MSSESTLSAAAPYLIGTAALTAGGIYLACAAAATAAVVTGVALAILGGYTFIGALFGTVLLDDADDFREHVIKSMLLGFPVLLYSVAQHLRDKICSN